MTKAKGPSEKWTRKQFIDHRLKEAEWKIVLERDSDPSKPLSVYDGGAIEEYLTDNGPADYALVRGGKVLGLESALATLGSLDDLSDEAIDLKGTVDESLRGLEKQR